MLVITDEYGDKMLTVNENATLNTTVTIQIMYEGKAITKTVTVVPAPTLTFTYEEMSGEADGYLTYEEFVTITVVGYDDKSLFNWELVQGAAQVPSADNPGMAKHYNEEDTAEHNCPGETIIKVSLKSDPTVWGKFTIECA